MKYIDHHQEDLKEKGIEQDNLEMMTISQNRLEYEAYSNAMSELKINKFFTFKQKIRNFIKKIKERKNHLNIENEYQFRKIERRDLKDLINENEKSNPLILISKMGLDFDNSEKTNDLDEKILSETAIQDWEKYYFNKTNNQENDIKNLKQKKEEQLNLFLKLVQYYGIPDVKNRYLQQDERYYHFHPDFLFCHDVENLLLFFMQDKIRNKEVAHHYDFYSQNYEQILEVREIKEKIDEIKSKANHNFELYSKYIEDKVKENKEHEITKKLESQFDETQKNLFNEYLTLTGIYNEKLRVIPNEITLVKDFFYFNELLMIANEGLLCLAFGDWFNNETFNILNKDNITCYLMLSILLSEKEIWEKYEITEEKLKNNIILINQKNQIFPIEILEDLIKMKNKENYQELITDINIEDLFHLIYQKQNID